MNFEEDVFQELNFFLRNRTSKVISGLNPIRGLFKDVFFKTTLVKMLYSRDFNPVRLGQRGSNVGRLAIKFIGFGMKYARGRD